MTPREIRERALHAHYRVYQKALKPRTGGGIMFVPGVGDVFAPIVFIGEAPGKEEDWRGKPFVGRSGQFLDASMGKNGIMRDEVFVTNLVKHWPPKFGSKQQPPDAEDILAACTLMRMELKIIQPRIVAPLGAVACRLWWPNPSMQAIAGTMYVKQGQVVFPLYHPSYALRNREAGKEFAIQMSGLAGLLRSIELGGGPLAGR